PERAPPRIRTLRTSAGVISARRPASQRDLPERRTRQARARQPPPPFLQGGPPASAPACKSESAHWASTRPRQGDSFSPRPSQSRNLGDPSTQRGERVAKSSKEGTRQ